MTATPTALFRQQLFTLARTLKIDPQVPENQVMDRIALSFRKLLNFLAQNEQASRQLFLLSAEGRSDQRLLSEIMQENLQAAQQSGVFRQDIALSLLAEFFIAMLLQLAQLPGDAPARHQQSLAATRLFCEGAWLKPD